MSKVIIRPYQEGKTGDSTLSRADAYRRDNDTVKVPQVTLYDIDFAIYYHLMENIKVRITVENGTVIPVPVIYANGEKWSQIRQHGYLRGVDKKVLAPLIVLNRIDVSRDEKIPILNLNNTNTSYKLFPYKNMGMQYDRTAGQHLKKDTVEYYLVDFPNYVTVNYEMVIWTDLKEQMNEVVHSILNTNNHVWGDVHTFKTSIQGINHENVNVPGEDRLVKTTMNLQVDGYLRSEYEYQKTKIQKQYSIKTVRFLEEGSEKIIFDAQDEYTTPNVRKEISTQDKYTVREESENLRKTIRR